MTLTRPAAKLTHEAALTSWCLGSGPSGDQDRPTAGDRSGGRGGQSCWRCCAWMARGVLSIDSATSPRRGRPPIAAWRRAACPPSWNRGWSPQRKGRLTNLKGGFPIIVDGMVVGGLGIGTGSPDQDVAVGKAALEALGSARMIIHPWRGRRTGDRTPRGRMRSSRPGSGWTIGAGRRRRPQSQRAYG